METKKSQAAIRRVLITLAFYLSVILAALILSLAHQVAGWVAQITIAFALLRLVYLFGWGTAKNGWRWRV